MGQMILDTPRQWRSQPRSGSQVQEPGNYTYRIEQYRFVELMLEVARHIIIRLVDIYVLKIRILS